MDETTLEFWKNMALSLKDELVERGNRIAELEAQLDMEMTDDLEIATGRIVELERRNNALFTRATQRLARVKELEAELIETKAWTPVPDGNYDAQHFNHAFTIDRDYLKLSVPGLDGDAHDEVEIGLPDGIRLCKQGK